ncbi:MAG: hypothetical protein CL429_02615 [Acidimicrobiaceae bacterium]|nr:hypothetical protein [Acidimicrobiaceae bacterium]|tara:strand:+ start:3974 stop:4225 length:252 start_codon:yes stop_codon:yes gene_type:complete
MDWNELVTPIEPKVPKTVRGFEEMFTVKEVMALTKQGMSTIYRLMEPWNVRKTSDIGPNGEIPYKKIGGSTRFTAETVRQLTT